MSLKPLLYGYLNVPVNAPRGMMARGERILKDYVWRENYALGTVFIERNANGPLAALTALIEAANRNDVRVVAVPTAWDLGSLPGLRRLTREVLAREADIRVIVVRVTG